MTKKENYATIVMDSTGDRKTDEFIEVHIYGKLNHASFLAVRGSSKSKNMAEEDIMERIKDFLKNNNKQWIEE